VRNALFVLVLLAACSDSGDGRPGSANLDVGLGPHVDGGVNDPATPPHDGAIPNGTDLAQNGFDLAMGSNATVSLSFDGCSPDFSANVIVVTNNDSMAVTRSDYPLEGQIQLHLTSSGTVQISTQERVDTGDVINILDGVVWTNISSAMPDPISGTLVIHDYDEAAGVCDLTFTNVVVENVSTHALCTINGSLKTTGKTF
jgi:hypothetical protein